MASGGVGGQGDGAGGKATGKGCGEDVTWLAEDRRYSKSAGAVGKPATKPKPRRTVKCRNCGDLCCSLARELVCEAFKLGVVDMSRKVSLFLIEIFSLNQIF